MKIIPFSLLFLAFIAFALITYPPPAAAATPAPKMTAAQILSKNPVPSKTARPTKTPTPTKTATPIKPTVPSKTPTAAPTPEGPWCNTGDSIVTLHEDIERWRKAGLDPVKQVNKYPAYLLRWGADALVPNTICTWYKNTKKGFEEAHQWGFSDAQIEDCKGVSLEPFSEENIKNAKYWFHAPDEGIVLDANPDTKTCDWIPIDLTHDVKQMLFNSDPPRNN